MKCPHCEYVDGYDHELMASVKGTQGGFYVSPVKLELRGEYWDNGTALSCGCPSCKKMFMEPV